MTYTFKLARRLAVSRNYRMLPVLLVIAACSGDATAPEGSPENQTGNEWRSRDILPVALTVRPSSVTLETNQLLQFRAHGHNSAGDSVGAAVTWSTSGGTILPDGRFSAAAIGTYTVVGASRVRGQLQVDTSTVQVVRRQTQLVAIEVTPNSVSLAPGVSQTFTALGRLMGGDAVPVGVNWSATGGSIDGGGTYVAGDTAGTYQVRATNTAGTLADTVTVTITAPPSLPPPAPVLASVVLMPSSVTLAPSATKQFKVYGRTTTNDSVAVDNVVFTATGGTVTAGGLYTAGSTAGTFRIIAKSGTLADTSRITISSPLGSGTSTGLPFGPAQQLVRTGSIVAPFNMTADGGYTASNILNRINAARSGGYKLLLQIPSGSHHDETSPLLSVIDGVLQFDEGKWRAQMDQFNTSTIRQAVAAAIADGTIVGQIVMDEPQVWGGYNYGGNTWGPKGTMTKLRVDGLCSYVKQIFPTMPTGVYHAHNAFEPDKSYRVCDFIVSPYDHRRGDIRAYRDGGVAIAQRDGHAIMFSLNVLDGGIQAARDGLWACDPVLTGGRGTFDPNCRMTAAQVRDWGILLGTVGCGLYMWRYDGAFVSKTENQQAFRDLGNRLASLPAKSCRRN
ncbi:MAG TPA: hypothetical protein VHH32_12520 [Gemmatimonadales bacterium]|nr:hypothetical protein [Gemmatimonadales bacterium]